MTPCVILGAGGHARAVAGALAANGCYEALGVLDDMPAREGEDILGLSVIGEYERLAELRGQGVGHAFLAIGDNTTRRQMFDRVRAMDMTLPVLCHPSATIEPSAEVGPGAYVGAMAYVGVGALIGPGALVNTRVSVDHESRIGAFAHLAPGVTVAGRSRIGDGAFLGIGCSVADRVEIGAAAVIGAGAVVLDDIPGGVTAFGIPARPRGEA